VNQPVTVIDYGAGNLASLSAALRRCGETVRITGDAEDVARAQRLILPGVGAAGTAMRELERQGLTDSIVDAVGRGATLLGICLGMHLLFDRSAEGGVTCLGLVPGGVRPIDWSRRQPHMGWNEVSPVTDHPLTESLPAVCYFAHSFAVEPDDRSAVAATTELDGRYFASVIVVEHVTGVQFHPERSGPDGARLLETHLTWSAACCVAA
jgi:imidazole glycerol-phosphate synthase subunit HisH